MTTEKRKAAKAAVFQARAERLFKAKEGPELNRLELAIRTGLAAADPAQSFLGNALHCMSLVQIQVEAVDGRFGEVRDPVHTLACIAQAYERLDRLVDAVSAELDRAEADNARRVRRAA